MKKAATQTKALDLPFGLTAADINPYPRWTKKKLTKQEVFACHVAHTIGLYEVTGIGWVVATLGISGSKSTAARTYAVDANGKVWRVGKGPHVLRTVTAYITNDRLKALAPLVELHTKGAVEANIIRDRISSRRAQGALHRIVRGW